MSSNVVDLYEGTDVLIWASGKKLYLKILNTTIELEKDEYDELSAGITIANSSIRAENLFGDGT